jgi:hypothetical protein
MRHRAHRTRRKEVLYRGDGDSVARMLGNLQDYLKFFCGPGTTGKRQKRAAGRQSRCSALGQRLVGSGAADHADSQMQS